MSHTSSAQDAASAPIQQPPLDLSHHFTRATKSRTPSSVKKFYKFFQIPGIGNLAGGESVPRICCFILLSSESLLALNRGREIWCDVSSRPSSGTMTLTCLICPGASNSRSAARKDRGISRSMLT